MSTKGVADVVFCLDSSASMQPCIDAVRKHVTDFLSGLRTGNQVSWDLRMDFLAHCTGSISSGGTVHRLNSLHSESAWEALYKPSQSSRFFTRDIEEFAQGLQRIQVQGDEASLIALDCCLDFPWRDSSGCHRVIIFLTDEPFETGMDCDVQRAKLPALIQKIQQLHVMLFLVAPDSPVYAELSCVDRSEYEVVDTSGDGLANVAFGKVLSYIGKSVSISTLQKQESVAPIKGLFGQERWGLSSGSFDGR